ncbi:MAG TPA: hypothetical protein VK802_14235 [Streptosporangiaceae bacterium]|nr:hypothetical protein [Streptosporangiaceae bacterium]
MRSRRTEKAQRYEAVTQVLRTDVRPGLGAGDACSAATLLLAASEGAVVICRAERDIRAFDLVAEQLIEHVRVLAARPS